MKKRLSHWLHEYSFSALYLLLCIFKLSRLLYCLWHTIHKYDLGLSCGCSLILLLSLIPSSVVISRLECTRVHFVQVSVSVSVSRPEDPGLGLGLNSQDSMLGAYACSTITVICSIFKLVLCHQLLMQPVMWSRDHGLETRVHSSSFCSGLGLGLETWWPRSQSWSRDLKKVLTTKLVPSDSLQIRKSATISERLQW